MTQVSRRYLDESILQRLFSLFFEAIGNQTTQEEFESIMNDLLSPSEKIMLAKRVAIIFLLLKNKDLVTISKTLKVSTSTASKFKYVKENAHGIVHRFEKIINNQRVSYFLEDLFKDLFLPAIRPWSNWNANLKERSRIQKERERGV